MTTYTIYFNSKDIIIFAKLTIILNWTKLLLVTLYTLKLGINAFIYFKTIEDWNKYGSYCSEFKEVIELYTESDTVAHDEQWIGEYCKYIKNTRPSLVSLICTTDTEKEKVLENSTKYSDHYNLAISCLRKSNFISKEDIVLEKKGLEKLLNFTEDPEKNKLQINHSVGRAYSYLV